MVVVSSSHSVVLLTRRAAAKIVLRCCRYRLDTFENDYSRSNDISTAWLNEHGPNWSRHLVHAHHIVSNEHEYEYDVAGDVIPTNGQDRTHDLHPRYGILRAFVLAFGGHGHVPRVWLFL
jgi:hypothetical protein